MDKILNSNKRVPKTEIKYKLSLTEEQKEAKGIIYNSKVTVLWGVPGTSKTLSAVATALDMFFKREVERIIISRPVVALEELGAIPGTFQEKLAPFLAPIMDNLYKLYDKDKIDKMVKDGYIQILPIAYIQGITIDDILIVDESQNVNILQLRQILTRLGKGGRIVLTGDVDQVALKDTSKSGFRKLLDLESKNINGLSFKEMKVNYRDEFVQEILKHY